MVQRDEERENFVAKPFYDVFALLSSEDNVQFRAKWVPSDACRPWMDDDGRVLDKRLAENVASRIKGKQGTVDKAQNKQSKESPPLPYSLSSLQIDAAKQLKMNAKETLDVCQKLYEKKLVTYPRSDCRYLPVEHWQESPEVLAAIRSNDENLSKAVDQALPERKSKAWNDKKVGAHHAIIPTSRRTDLYKLDARQRQLYTLIARQYVAQFYDDHRYTTRRLEVLIEGGLFVAKSRQSTEDGWKVLFARPGKKQALDNGNEQEASNAFLPDLKKGDPVQCLDAEIKDKLTQPPKAFTDATLLSAMTGIARFVKDPAIRKILKDTDGLGTEATRAGIIELLFNRQFLTRQGKEIHATATGKALIKALPEAVGLPDMTAQWEAALNDIVERKGSYAGFMEKLDHRLRELLNQARQDGMGDISHLPQSSPSRSFRGKKGSKGKQSGYKHQRASKNRRG